MVDCTVSLSLSKMYVCVVQWMGSASYWNETSWFSFHQGMYLGSSVGLQSCWLAWVWYTCGFSGLCNRDTLEGIVVARGRRYISRSEDWCYTQQRNRSDQFCSQGCDFQLWSPLCYICWLLCYSSLVSVLVGGLLVLQDEETGAWYQHRGRDFKVPFVGYPQDDDNVVGATNSLARYQVVKATLSSDLLDLFCLWYCWIFSTLLLFPFRTNLWLRNGVTKASKEWRLS